jgi:hypothetical protein
MSKKSSGRSRAGEGVGRGVSRPVGVVLGEGEPGRSARPARDEDELAGRIFRTGKLAVLQVIIVAADEVGGLVTGRTPDRFCCRGPHLHTWLSRFNV